MSSVTAGVDSWESCRKGSQRAALLRAHPSSPQAFLCPPWPIPLKPCLVPRPPALYFSPPSVDYHVRSAHPPEVSCLHPSFLSPVSPLLAISTEGMQGSWGRTLLASVLVCRGPDHTLEFPKDSSCFLHSPLPYLCSWCRCPIWLNSSLGLYPICFRKPFYILSANRLALLSVPHPQHSYLGSDCSRMSNSAGDSYPPAQSEGTLLRWGCMGLPAPSSEIEGSSGPSVNARAGELDELLPLSGDFTFR